MKTPTEAKEAIQREFDEYQRKLVMAKRRFNMYTLVACFPTEVLSDIFTHYQYLIREAEGDLQGAHNGRPYHWLKVTHICYFWRHTALSTPHLWTRITVTNAACIKEMFRRANNVGLSLKITVSPLLDNHKALQTRVNVAQRCLSTLQIFDCVDILAGDTQDVADLFKNASSPAHLQTLIISTMGMPGMPESRWEGSPAGFIKKPMPKLRYLQYEGANFQWTEAAFRPTLTYLDIRNGSATGQTDMFTVTQIIRALQTMPGLQHLTLVDVFASNQAECRTSAPIDMPALKTIRLDASAKHCANLLECISIPSHTSLTFKMDGDTPFVRLATAICTKLEASGAVLKSASFSRETEHSSLWVYAWSNIRSLTTIHTQHASPLLTFCVTVQRQNTDAKAIEQLLADFSLPEVRTLYLNGIRGLTKAVWTKLAPRLPALRGVRLKGNTAEGLPEILASKPLLPSKLQASSSSRAPHYFPRLHTLLFDEVRFETTNAQGHSFLRRLNTAITVRRRGPALGIIKKVMVVQGIDIAMGEILSLKKVVPVVLWDGYELTLDGEGKIFDQYAGVGGKRGDDIEDDMDEYEG